MRLRSTRDQTVRCGRSISTLRFVAGEEMRTEISAKFRRASASTRELAAAGLELVEWWTDPAGDFALSLSRLRLNQPNCLVIFRPPGAVFRRTVGDLLQRVARRGSPTMRKPSGTSTSVHDFALDFDAEVPAHDRDALEAQPPDPLGNRGREVKLRCADVGLEAQHRAQEQQRRRRGPRLRRTRGGIAHREPRAVRARHPGEQLGQAGRRTTVTRRRARASRGARIVGKAVAHQAGRARWRCRAATRCRSDTRSGCNRRSPTTTCGSPTR